MKLKKSVAEILTDGYLVMMALFFAVAFPAMKLGWTLSVLSWIWILLIIIVVLTLLRAWRVVKGTKKVSEILQVNRAFFPAMVLSMIISISFTRPYVQDSTLEIVKSAVAADCIAQSPAPIEMLYASLIQFTGIRSEILLYYVFPIFLLAIFFAGIWQLGSVLFDEKEKVAGFALFVIVIYWMTTLLEGQSVVTGIFLNCWNGLTWLSCFVMPVALANFLSWMEEATDGKIMHRFSKVCKAIVLLLAAQLSNDKGGFYVTLMLFVTAAVILVRKGYDYGITSGRFKKRV